jgi:hypothetical protein
MFSLLRPLSTTLLGVKTQHFIFKKVKHKMEKENLIKLAEELPQIIKDKRTFLLSKYNRREELNLSIRAKEMQLKREISEETTIDMKKKFTNETARDCELAARLQLNEEYQLLFNELKTLKSELEVEEINLSYLLDRYSSVKTIARVMYSSD